MIGRVLGERYHLMREIGHGANGIVYLAVDLCIRQNRAVKELSKQAHAEAELLLSLNHEHIMQAVELLTEDGKDYLVCEYIDGNTLEQTVRKHVGCHEGQVILWGIELAEALIYLHDREHPVIHRDIKPANIMIDRNQSVKLIDFGIAERLYPEGELSGLGEGKAYGSVGFAAPEQYGDRRGRICRRMDARADLYAVGKTLMYVYMQCGIRTGIGMRHILCKCTRLNPRRRYRSTGRLRHALRRLYQVKYPSCRKLLLRGYCLAGVLFLSGILYVRGAWRCDVPAESKAVHIDSEAAAVQAGDRSKDDVRGNGLYDEQEQSYRTERFFEDYEELKLYVQGVMERNLYAEPSAERYEMLLELSCLYMPIQDERAAREEIRLLETGLSELKGCLESGQYGTMSERACTDWYGVYCQQLFMQYRLLGQRELQENKAGALQDMTAAVQYGEACLSVCSSVDSNMEAETNAATDTERAALFCDLGRVYEQLGSPPDALMCYRRGVAELAVVPVELYIAYLDLLLRADSELGADEYEELRQLYTQASEMEEVTEDTRFERIRVRAEYVLEEEQE